MGMKDEEGRNGAGHSTRMVQLDVREVVCLLLRILYSLFDNFLLDLLGTARPGENSLSLLSLPSLGHCRPCYCRCIVLLMSTKRSLEEGGGR